MRTIGEMDSNPGHPVGPDPGEVEARKRKIESALIGAKTFGEFFRRHYDTKLKDFWAKFPDGEKLRRQFLRYFEPWPEWALRCVVEVTSVLFPRIRKELIYDGICLIHAFAFEVRLDGALPETPLMFPEVDARVVGTLIGHGLALPGYLRQKMGAALAKGWISKEKHIELVSKYPNQLSEEEFLREMQPHLQRYFDARATAWGDFCEALADAKRNTLDKHGELKDTTLTSVYLHILENWPEIEEMSGPAEFCAFLDPLLVGSDNDPDKKLDRVKKICKRLDIQFRPLVKGRGE